MFWKQQVNFILTSINNSYLYQLNKKVLEKWFLIHVFFCYLTNANIQQAKISFVESFPLQPKQLWINFDRLHININHFMLT